MTEMASSDRPLFNEICSLINDARTRASRQINSLLVVTNFEIGRRIVLHEQKGESRAAYGKAILKRLSTQLHAEFGRGFSVENLTNIRRFYLAYRDDISKSQTLSTISKPRPGVLSDNGKAQEKNLPLQGTTDSQMTHRFTLSWSHYVFLIGIRNQDERRFYEIESTEQSWSLRELRRQYDSSLYERLALSRDKEAVHSLSKEGLLLEKLEDLLKEPYVLEFLGLEERTKYSESELESRIIDKIEHFLLELGKGFLFEARQRRFTFDDEHFYIDLVFYNRLLRCYVLIDLKIGKITHQDLGQMQMYVNYFDREVKLDYEHPTIGIILCKKKHDALVEITLPKGANIQAREYSLYLPSKTDLQRKLLEWMDDEDKV